MTQISPLASIVSTGASGAAQHGPRKVKVYGLVVHTTGGGVPDKATRTKRDPLDVAIQIYCAGPNAAHYVIGYTGVMAQIIPDDVVGWHVGGGADKRAAYLDGTWRQKCAPAAVHAWDKQWSPKYASPQHLFPGTSVNSIYVGVELIPCAAKQGAPASVGDSFTEAQYVALIALCRDLAIRHGWPQGWAQGPRLVGHEDVGILDRHDDGGGWDPGFLRAKPKFNFSRVRSAL